MVIRIKDPMAYNSNILLGQISKVSGYQGAVYVILEKEFSENKPAMESVFLEIEGKQVPFFISNSEFTGTGTLKLKFEGYDTVERIGEFTGCRVFLTTSVPEDKTVEDIQTLREFKVIVEGNKLLGSVTEVIPNPGQWLLNILSTEKKNILIPFHEHFIVSIDKAKKTIFMDIPEGLIDIN